MMDHLFHDYQHYITSFWTIIVLVLFITGLLLLRFGHKNKLAEQRYLNASHQLKSSLTSKAKNLSGVKDDEIGTHDTIFIVPDISHYTRFIAGKHFSPAQAQEIIFSLVNAMIEASADTFELSKFEGDAVLFFADAREHSPEIIGLKIIAMFDAFFEEKQQILESGICSCDACKHIDNLDLKVFVHRGEAARFSFRGSIDHFGTDVIILYRLMKNNVEGDRYVMVTDAARDSVSLNGNFSRHAIEEYLDDVGKINATVHRFAQPIVRQNNPLANLA
ncbi:MAG: DUF2652 domain-containing protein [Roseovarius sp.]|nr:DUF2652 domain-containing protein [Roseovarius sp.]